MKISFSGNSGIWNHFPLGLCPRRICFSNSTATLKRYFHIPLVKCGVSTITQLSASYSILTKSHISHLKMDPMWVAVVFETILHSPEMDPKILYPTLQKWILKNYFPLSQHESTLHNIYIQNFWSLGNADTPLLTRGIWKYLFWVAVVFETIYHSGFALVEYGFKYHCYPQKIFSYPTR